MSVQPEKNLCELQGTTSKRLPASLQETHKGAQLEEEEAPVYWPLSEGNQSQVMSISHGQTFPVLTSPCSLILHYRIQNKHSEWERKSRKQGQKRVR